MIETLAEFPDALSFLFDPHRYKVCHGGRGKGASWSFARALLIQGCQQPLRVLCARETQKSIADSVHALLSDQVKQLGLSDIYNVQQASIAGRNGTEFIFAGLKHNVNNIKSVEGCDRVWVEEAQAVSKQSWETLIPTIRKEGSEIWASFNADLPTDDTYKRFVVSPPPNARVAKLTYRDNPWFPDVLREEMEHLKLTDPHAYDHVWEGNCRSTIEGAIYQYEIGVAEREGRICRVPYEASKPVDTYWDLGYGDMVSIWFAQVVAFEYRIIDYYQNTQKAIDFYMQEMQRRGYTYGTCVLPWDGGAKSLGTGRSIQEMMTAKGYRVRVLQQSRVIDGINAVRTIFPQCFFDADRCADGIQALRRYQWAPPSANGVIAREPLHNDASHPADALRSMGMSIKTPQMISKPKAPIEPMQYEGGPWS